jgi:hypothetical protein
VLSNVRARLQRPPSSSRSTAARNCAPDSRPLTGRVSEPQVIRPCASNRPEGRPGKLATAVPASASAPTEPVTCIRRSPGHGRVCAKRALLKVTAARGCPTGVTVTVARYDRAGPRPATSTPGAVVGPTL